jgi:hypothetical protein
MAWVEKEVVRILFALFVENPFIEVQPKSPGSLENQVAPENAEVFSGLAKVIPFGGRLILNRQERKCLLAKKGNHLLKRVFLAPKHLWKPRENFLTHSNSVGKIIVKQCFPIFQEERQVLFTKAQSSGDIARISLHGKDENG